MDRGERMTNTNHSLPKGTSDEHYTPKALFDLLGITFDLDVAAPIGGSGIAPKWFDKDSDGLAQEWFGNVWMNPPYSNPTPWVEKFVAYRGGGWLYFQSQEDDGGMLCGQNLMQSFHSPITSNLKDRIVCQPNQLYSELACMR